MRPFPVSSLAVRLLLLLGLAVLPWLGTIGYALHYEARQARAQAIAQLQTMVQAAASQQLGLIQETRVRLALLAATPGLADGDGAACQAHLESYDLLSWGYANVGLIGPDGVLLCDLRGGAGTYLGDRDYVRAAREDGSFAVGHYIVGRVTGRPVFPMAQPVSRGQGGEGRVLFAAVDTRWMQRVLETVPLPPGATLTLLDGQGVVLAHLPAADDWVGRPFVFPAVFRSLVRGEEEGVVEAPEPLPSLIAYSTVKFDGRVVAHVVARVPTAVVMAPVREGLGQAVGWVAVLTLLVFGFAWHLSRLWVLRPIAALREMAARIAAGDLTARSGLSASGELGELAHGLDAMAASLQRSRLETERIMDVVPEGILLTDQAGRIVMANARCEALFGYRREELLGQSLEILLPEDRRAAHQVLRADFVARPRSRDMGTPGLDLQARRKDGSVFPVDVSLAPLQTDEGLWVVAAVRDVSERRHFEEQILHQATHDALTGLPNRLLYRQLLEQAMRQAERDETLLAVLFLDLDGFKTINDTLGHGAGDALLVQVAARIRGALRASDVVGRLGGDEFTILLAGIRHVHVISQIADNILAAIARPYEVEGREVNITASIGITVFPLDDANADSLLRNADTAMYHAKQEGRNRYSYYTAEMNRQMRQRLEVETGLRHALRENQFEVFYQPQVEVGTGRWVGLEALIRWRHPARGLIPPAEFIPVAEDSGLIEAIGEWVLTAVCRQIIEWDDKGFPPLRVAVNLSARQFAKPNLVDEVAAIFRSHGKDVLGERIELEVTESMLVGDMPRSVAQLKALREMGLKLAIDDFGTGYSSLSYLKRLPLTALKIDRSFIDGVTHGEDDAAIARAIIELAHSLRLAVVAEGVETTEQWQWLREHGCDLAQGYLFGRPMPAADVEAQLVAQRPSQSAA